MYQNGRRMKQMEFCECGNAAIPDMEGEICLRCKKKIKDQDKFWVHNRDSQEEPDEPEK